jgi:radical SAM superfamily enzyme YgiQ (UPF0313 family)
LNRPDIALVRGPTDSRLRSLPVPPLGLLYIAAALERAGRRVAIVDAEAEALDARGFEARVRALRPRTVGLTGMTPMRERIAETAALVRPHCDRIVLGGVHATRFREAALAEFPEIDALVVGEGEETAPALLDWWDRGGPLPSGVLARGEPFVERPPPSDLDALPLPARHLVPNRAYRYLFQSAPGFTTAVTSRGCPFRCTFCDKTVSGSGWRARSAASVVAELVEIRNRHGLGYVCFFDDNFTLRRKRVEAICDGILRAGLDIAWKCEARVDGITPDLARRMRRAGCRTVAFGIESGNPESLALLKKDQDLDQMAAAIRACRDASIETVAYVLVGIPGETPETTMRTLEFAVSSDVDFIQFSTLSPFPGTELWDEAIRQGWFRESSVRNPVDAERRRATVLPPGWSERDLDRTLRRMYGGFYLRPRWLARQSARALRERTLMPRARLGASVLRWLLLPRRVG